MEIGLKERMKSKRWFEVFFVNFYSDDNDHYHPYLLPGNKLPGLNKSDLLSLEQPFMWDEIKKTLFDIRAHKAPGLDGFHALFCQHFWETTGKNLIHLALSILSCHDFPETFNDTFLVLIPKVENR